MTEEDFDNIDPLDPNDLELKQADQLDRRAYEEGKAQQELRDRRDAYLRFFGGTGTANDKRLVMGDLRRFCRGGETPWDNDPRVHALLTGRFEVFMRIQDHLELTFDDLWERYSK